MRSRAADSELDACQRELARQTSQVDVLQASVVAAQSDIDDQMCRSLEAETALVEAQNERGRARREAMALRHRVRLLESRLSAALRAAATANTMGMSDGDAGAERLRGESAAAEMEDTEAVLYAQLSQQRAELETLRSNLEQMQELDRVRMERGRQEEALSSSSPSPLPFATALVAGRGSPASALSLSPSATALVAGRSSSASSPSPRTGARAYGAPTSSAPAGAGSAMGSARTTPRRCTSTATRPTSRSGARTRRASCRASHACCSERAC